MSQLHLLPLVDFLSVNDDTTVKQLKEVVHLTQKYPLDEVCVQRPNGEVLDDDVTWKAAGRPEVLTSQRMCTVKVGGRSVKMLPGSTVADVKAKLGVDTLRMPAAAEKLFVARAAAMRQTLASVSCSVARIDSAVTDMDKKLRAMYRAVESFAGTKVGETKDVLLAWVADRRSVS